MGDDPIQRKKKKTYGIKSKHRIWDKETHSTLLPNLFSLVNLFFILFSFLYCFSSHLFPYCRFVPERSFIFSLFRKNLISCRVSLSKDLRAAAMAKWADSNCFESFQKYGYSSIRAFF